MPSQKLFEEAIKPKLQLESIQRAKEDGREPLMETSILAVGAVTGGFLACQEKILTCQDVSQVLLSIGQGRSKDIENKPYVRCRAHCVGVCNAGG